ncbi:MAG: bifunctional nuclease family protein [Gemmatimonadaceae bacterium]|nr:bifunctional nuclease family protein [Gemmatimonadaceae bacterium]
MVEVEVARLGLDASQQAYVVVLQEKGGERQLPIWIGRPEAEAIAAHLNGIVRERPMTHDLLASVVGGLGGLLRRVCVTRVHEGTFHAELHCTKAGASVMVDARPSDAIALALRLDAPILVAEALLAEDADEVDGRGERPPAGGDADPLSADELQRHLAQLRPEDFGRFSL